MSGTPKDKTILVIDDTQKILDIVAYFLEHDGYSVCKADNPYDGIHRANEGGIDLIILDIMMPGMDGYQVYAKLKEDGVLESVPVIMLTAHTVIQHTPREFFFGLYGFLPKPFTRNELLKKVKEVLALVRGEEPAEEPSPPFVSPSAETRRYEPPKAPRKPSP